MKSLILSNPNFLSPFFRFANDVWDMANDRTDTNSPVSTLRTSADIYETDEAIHLNIEMPGVKKEDVSINITSENILVVKGEKKYEYVSENATCYLQERSYGNFERRFNVPTYINTDEIKASFNAGVLSLQMTKKAEVKPKEIKIAVE